MSAGWEPTVGHVARTVAHLIGIVGGLVILSLAEIIRRRTKGSAMSSSMLMVEIGTLLFVLVFLDMEANHFLDVQLWYFADSMLIRQTWWMVALAFVMGSFALAYRRILRKVGV